MDDVKTAQQLLYTWKHDAYLFGWDILSSFGSMIELAGTSAVLVATDFPGAETYIQRITDTLVASNVKLLGVVAGAQPNCPLEDLERITQAFKHYNPDFVISFGGGSTIDAVKAAEVLRTLGGTIHDYFGTNLVTKALQEKQAKLHTHIAIQTAASSGAHLTKYANITDIATGQKKLIVDPAIIPQFAVFDYSVTANAPTSLIVDGALDGVAHIIEVLIGLEGKEGYDTLVNLAKTGIPLVLENLPKVLADPTDMKARTALCYATDLGGYAIMIGGTNGGHLTSFSLIDILSHGRACAIMNPYYLVFFSDAIEASISLLATLYHDFDLIDGYRADTPTRIQAEKLAKAMLVFAERIGFPRTLAEITGFTNEHISRALEAAKHPQLKMKLENMPMPMRTEDVDRYMGSILHAAKNGDFSVIIHP